MTGESTGRWIGVDLGGTKTRVASFDGEGQEQRSERFSTPSGPEEALSAIARAVAQLEESAGPAAGIGVGFCGLVDRAGGRVLSSVILEDFAGCPLAAALSDLTGRPVHLENDATAAGYGEYVARGRRAEEILLVLTIGTGIGGAAVIGGEPLRGASGVAAEFGNMTVDLDGSPHACGNRGCLNTFAAGRALAARAGRGSLEEAARAAREGDRRAARAISEGARALGAGLANLVHAFNPHRISLMGGVLALGDDFLAAALREAQERSFPEAWAAVSIGPCRLGEATGSLGAAMLAREALR